MSEIEIKDKRLRSKRLTSEARIPTKVSKQVAGHDLYAQGGTKIPAKGQGIIGKGNAIGLPLNIYGRIAPRSGLTLKHFLAVNAGVIDADYTREIKVVLVNLGAKGYAIHKGEKIAQLIGERIASEEAILVENLETTKRGTKEFGSSDMELIKQVCTGADLLVKSATQEMSLLKKQLRRPSTGHQGQEPDPCKLALMLTCLLSNRGPLQGLWGKTRRTIGLQARHI